jgi:(2Fe-2S) ferredoxin
MRPASLAPYLHFLVCANRRPPDSPLGAGCSHSGDSLFEALKNEVLARGRVADVWVTKTFCLGVCPRLGATVAVYPKGLLLTEALPGDAPTLYERGLALVEARDPGRE